MENELNFLDKFLYKFIICLILLVAVFGLGKLGIINVDNVKEKMSGNINFLKIFTVINGEDGLLIPIEITDEVSSTVSQTYQNFEEIEGGKRILLNDMHGVEVYKTGIIIKIIQNKDMTYQVTVKGLDSKEYTYNNLETIDCNIYQIVKSGEILGLPKSQGTKNYFDFYVKSYV